MTEVSLGTKTDVYAQRIQGDGTIGAGWAANGVPATRDSADQDNPDVAPDGQGGAYVAWQDWRSYPATQATDVYAQHLTAAGEPAPGWLSDGLPVCTDPAPRGSAYVLPDGAGGVIVVWLDARRGGYMGDVDVYAQHLLADGSLAPGWPPCGLPVVMGRTKERVAPDGAGGFYVGCSTVDSFGSDLEYFVQRFTFLGVRAPGWPDGGVRVCAAVGVGSRDGLRVAPDGLGGLLLTWFDSRVGAYEVYAARVLPDGSLGLGWTLNGVRLSDPTGPGNEFTPSIASDGQGGAYVAWRREDNAGNYGFIQHVTAGGEVAPGWPAYGVRLDPTAGQFDPRVVEDGQGGVIAVWDGGALDRQGIYAQRYGPGGPTPVLVSLASAAVKEGRVELDWFSSNGAALSASIYRRTDTSGWQSLGSVNPDGSGHIRYEDRAVSPGARYAYRLGYVENGIEQFSAETWVEVPALRLTLEGLRPNPAVGELVASFTLPSGAPARLQLLDVTGRVWLAREVGSLGAGNHLVRLSRRACTGCGSPRAVARCSPGASWYGDSTGGKHRPSHLRAPPLSHRPTRPSAAHQGAPRRSRPGTGR